MVTKNIIRKLLVLSMDDRKNYSQSRLIYNNELRLNYYDCFFAVGNANAKYKSFILIKTVVNLYDNHLKHVY